MTLYNIQYMAENSNQPFLPKFGKGNSDYLSRKKTNGQMNKLDPSDQRFHDWYRFVLSFPPHLVQKYIFKFGLNNNTSTILDPFCGTGTTIVEAKLRGIKAIGVEANYFAQFASDVKTDWDVNPENLKQISLDISNNVNKVLSQNNTKVLKKLPDAKQKLLIKNSLSPKPLHKTLCLLEEINKYNDEACYGHLRLALANALVFSISNLRFGPEVGAGKIKKDAPVVELWQNEINKICHDIEFVKGKPYPKSKIILGDSRVIDDFIPTQSIDAVITSPPYPNEKDYSRTTRLETVVLGFVDDMKHLRALKKTFIRSNTRGVYKNDSDRIYVEDNSKVQKLVAEIENRRIQLGKTSGFEKLYPKVTEEYFGGMKKHLISLQKVLKPGAQLAYVVGDQASYLRVMIRTGEILADIAVGLGYNLERIDLFRTRYATATKENLREEVLVLTWPG